MVSSTNDMTEKERLLSTLHGGATDRQPFVIPAGLIAAPLFTSTSLCEQNAHSLAELSCRIRWLTGAENLALPHTMRVLSGALGGEKDQPPNATPVEEYPLEDVDQWKRLEGVDPFADRGVELTVRCIEVLSRSYPQVPVVGDVPAPLSLAVGIVSAEKVLLSAVKDKEALASFLSFLTGIVEEYALRLVRAGADVIFIKDEFSALLGEELFGSISLPPIRRLVAKVQKSVPAILHLCGDVSSIVEPLKRSGISGLSVDAEVSIEELKRALPSIAIMGNICVEGDVESRFTVQVRSLLSERPHIVAPACGLVDRISLERLIVAKTLLFNS